MCNSLLLDFYLFIQQSLMGSVFTVSQYIIDHFDYLGAEGFAGISLDIRV